MRLLNLLVAAVSLASASCFGAFVPVRRISIEERAELEAMPVLRRGDLPSDSFKVVGTVEGHSCQNKTWDPYPSKTDAMDQMKAAARALGANAVASVRCEARGTSMLTNCWGLITCNGEARSVVSRPPAEPAVPRPSAI